jgi:hypothetical protein
MAADIGNVLGSVLPKGGGVGINWTLVGGFVIITLVAFMIYFSLRKHFYPIKIIIKRRLGAGEVIIEEHGKIVSHEGTKKLHLFSLNKYLPVPSLARLTPFKGFFKKWIIIMFQDPNGDVVEGDFKLIHTGTDSDEYMSEFIPANQAKQEWAQQQRKRVIDRYSPDFWSKYGVLVGEGVLVMALIITTIIIANKNLEGAEAIGRAIDNAATVIQTIKAAG